jgi:hypothetical protein
MSHHEVCSRCRVAVLYDDQCALDEREVRLLHEFRARGEFSPATAAIRDTYCECCGCDEPELQLYALSCVPAPIPDDVYLDSREWFG